MRTLTVRELNADEQSECVTDDRIILAIELKDENGVVITHNDYIYPGGGNCFKIGELFGSNFLIHSPIIGFGNIVRALKELNDSNRIISRIYTRNLPIESVHNNSIIHEVLNGQAMLVMSKLLTIYQNIHENDKIIMDTLIGNCDNIWDTKSNQYISHPWKNFIYKTVKDIMENILYSIKSQS